MCLRQYGLRFLLPCEADTLKWFESTKPEKELPEASKSSICYNTETTDPQTECGQDPGTIMGMPLTEASTLRARCGKLTPGICAGGSVTVSYRDMPPKKNHSSNVLKQVLIRRENFSDVVNVTSAFFPGTKSK